MEAEDDWEDVLENQSSLRLWRLIDKKHLAKITGSTEIDLDDAMEEKNESLADHQKRFERTVSALERVMTHLPTMASWPPGTSGEKSYGMVTR